MKKWLDQYQLKGEVKYNVPTGDNLQYKKPIVFNNEFIKEKRNGVIKEKRNSINLPNQIFASNTRDKILADRRKHYFPYEIQQTKNIRDLADEQVFQSSGDLISAVHPVGVLTNILNNGLDKSLPFEFSKFLPDKIGARGYDNFIPFLKPASKLIDPIQMFDKLRIADSLYNSADSIDLYNQFKNGGLISKNSLNRKVTCSNCGWSWKLSDGGLNPMTCHKCGGDIKMQNGGEPLDEYQYKGEYKGQIPSGVGNPVMDRGNFSNPGLNKNQLKNINQNLKNKVDAEKRQLDAEKRQEIENYKAAELFHKYNPVAQLLGTRSTPVGTIKPTAREIAYGAGAGINEFYDVPGIGIVNDFVNPLSLVSKGIISPWLQAPLQAQQSDSYLPYAGAALSTALTVPMVRPASIAAKTILNPRNIYRGALGAGKFLGYKEVPKPTSVNSNELANNADELVDLWRVESADWDKMIHPTGPKDPMLNDFMDYYYPYDAYGRWFEQDINRLIQGRGTAAPGLLSSNPSGQLNLFKIQVPKSKLSKYNVKGTSFESWSKNPESEYVIDFDRSTTPKITFSNTDEGWKSLLSNATSNASSTKPFVFNQGRFNEAKGFLDRYQHLKKLKAEGLIAKDADILKYARSEEGVNDITKRAIEKANTKYRGVYPDLNKYNLTGESYGSGVKITEDILKSTTEAMKNAGVDITNPVAVGEYMSTHIPLHTFGYRSGVNKYSMPKDWDVLFTESVPNSSYGSHQYEMKLPFNFEQGNYKDWYSTFIKNNAKKGINELERNTKPSDWINRTISYQSELYPGMPYFGGNDGVYAGPKGFKIFDSARFLSKEEVENLSKKLVLPKKFGGPIVTSRGQLDKYQNKGEVLTPAQQVALANSIAKNPLRVTTPAPAVPVIKQGYAPTPYTEYVREERNKEYARNKAMQNSDLAKTFSSFTPGGNNIEAGVMGAETFANLNPVISGPILSASRLAPAIMHPTNNAYWGSDRSIGQNALGVLGAAGDVAMISPYFKGAGEYLTTQTPLKNTYKINPWAFKPNPEAYYRGIGKSGIDDAIESGLLRTANKTGNYGEDLYMTSDFNAAKQGYSRDKSIMKFNPEKISTENPWGVEHILPQDTKSYIAEIPKQELYNSEIQHSFIIKNKGALPINNIKLYKEDWLRGYKEVPISASTSSSLSNTKNKFDLFDLNNVRKASGSIGNQGATPEGARDILKSIGIEVKGAKSGQPTFKEMVEHLKNNPKDAATYQKFLEKEPISISELPGGEYQLNDGHHRATLAYYSGNENIPAIIKNKGEYKKKKGGIIEDDRGQWAHPGEITQINSPYITMRGVNYPVLGVDNTGHTKMMQPGMDYTFPGQYVTEYPMAQNGYQVGQLPTRYVTGSQRDFDRINSESPLVLEKDGRYRNDVGYVFEFKKTSPRMQSLQPQYMQSSPISMQGQPLYIQPMTLPQQHGRPVYGPGNTIIGYSNDNMKFTPAYQYTGAPNSEFNLQDKELLNNPELLKQYIYNQDSGYHYQGGGQMSIQDIKNAYKTAAYNYNNRIFPKETLQKRQAAYNTINPTDYTDLRNYGRWLSDEQRDVYSDPRSEEAWKFYLGLNKPEDLRYLRKSKYRPTINATQKNYYSVDPDLEQDLFNAYKDKVELNKTLQTDESELETPLSGDSGVSMLGRFGVSRGQDENGDYLSYYDKYDLKDFAQKRTKGVPYSIYGRIYYPKKEQGGEMIKRADGSYSRRGLWDNIRANRGSGKEPTKEMLEQERKIRSKYEQGGVVLNAGGEKHRIYVKSTNRGEGAKGHIMVNHPTMDKGMWDTIDLTEKAGATTIAQGVAATKKWHRENPYMKQEGGEKEEYWRTKKPMVNDPSMDAISKVLLQRNLGKNFMQRAAGFGYQGGIPTRYIPGEDPDSNAVSTLLMSFGDNQVFPTIIQTGPEQLSYQPYQTQEYLEAPTWDVADYFAAKGYKRAANDMYGMEYKNGGYVVRRSHDRKGKTHVVIGPDGTKKYFGDPNMGERGKSKYGKEAFYARHKKNLAKNPYFRAYARATWEEGGETYAIGGQSTLNPIVKKDNRNWLDYLKN